MKKPPLVIFLISSIMLFHLLYQIGFDITALQLSIERPLQITQIFLPTIIIIGLICRQLWAWYFAAIIATFRIINVLILFSLSLPNGFLGVVYLLTYHGLVLWLLFHQDVSVFFNFKVNTSEQRIKQTLKYGVVLIVLMIPIAWLTVAYNR